MSALLDDLNALEEVPIELQRGTIELLNDYHRLKRCCRAAREEIIRLNRINENLKEGGIPIIGSIS